MLAVERADPQSFLLIKTRAEKSGRTALCDEEPRRGAGRECDAGRYWAVCHRARIGGGLWGAAAEFIDRCLHGRHALREVFGQRHEGLDIGGERTVPFDARRRKVLRWRAWCPWTSPSIVR